MNVGGLIQELKAPYDSLQAALAGGEPASLLASVKKLNPLSDPKIGQAVAQFQRFQKQFSTLAQMAPPAELVSRYEDQVEPKLKSLIPSWAKENISPASIKRAFQLANPLNISAEVDRLYEAIKQQLRNFDPRLVQEKVKASFDKIKDAIFTLDPSELAAQVQEAIAALNKKLDGIDLQLIADELDSVANEVKNIIAGLNPQPIIKQLQGLVKEVMEYLDSLKPSNVLSELEGSLESAKVIVAQFNPKVFKEPLEKVFKEIQTILKEIDIGVVLQPLAERLEQLRDELEEGLKRTETAFNGMLAAIPV